MFSTVTILKSDLCGPEEVFRKNMEKLRGQLSFLVGVMRLRPRRSSLFLLCFASLAASWQVRNLYSLRSPSSWIHQHSFATKCWSWNPSSRLQRASAEVLSYSARRNGGIGCIVHGHICAWPSSLTVAVIQMQRSSPRQSPPGSSAKLLQVAKQHNTNCNTAQRNITPKMWTEYGKSI